MWFDIIKAGGSVKKVIRKFIREHLENMQEGESITTNEMVDLVRENMADATFLAPTVGTRPEMQVKFGNVKVDKYTSPRFIGSIMIRENTDIVDVPRRPDGRGKGLVVRK